MTPEEILTHSATALEQAQREFYFAQGYLSMPELIEQTQLDALRGGMHAALEASRGLTASNNNQFDLERGHTAQKPRLRRAAHMDDLNDACWAFCRDSIVVDIAADILGPDVRFRDAFINFKWSDGGPEVKWHQDIAFYPHTNVGICQFLLALEDVQASQGPLQVIPGSHTGPVYEHRDSLGEWTGAISDADLCAAGIGNAVELTGPAGTLTVHHSCTVHGSAQNMSALGRPMLVITYSAADAVPYTAAPYLSSHHGEMVRGTEPGYAHHQEFRIPLPPDWSAGYTSIYSHQEHLVAACAGAQDSSEQQAETLGND